MDESVVINGKAYLCSEVREIYKFILRDDRDFLCIPAYNKLRKIGFLSDDPECIGIAQVNTELKRLDNIKAELTK